MIYYRLYITRVLPSISIDEAFCCIDRSVAFAEVLYYSRRTWSLCCTDVLLHLQKFCPVMVQLAWQGRETWQGQLDEQEHMAGQGQLTGGGQLAKACRFILRVRPGSSS